MKNLHKEVSISPTFTAIEWGIKPDIIDRSVVDSLNWALIDHYRKKDSTQLSVEESMTRVIRRLQNNFVDHGVTARILVNNALREIYAKSFLF